MTTCQWNEMKGAIHCRASFFNLHKNVSETAILPKQTYVRSLIDDNQSWESVNLARLKNHYSMDSAIRMGVVTGGGGGQGAKPPKDF